MEDFKCDPTSCRGLFSRIMSSAIIPASIEGSPSCRAKIRWCLSLAAAASVQKIVVRPKGYCNSIERWKWAIVEWSRLPRTASSKRTSIAAESEPTGLFSPIHGIVQKDLDIAEYTDPVHNPIIPHVIVLEPGLVIYKIYNGYWFFGRPTIEELRQDLRAVSKKCRPDWDITTLELKALWQQGRKELFYPYGKAPIKALREQD